MNKGSRILIGIVNLGICFAFPVMVMSCSLSPGGVDEHEVLVPRVQPADKKAELIEVQIKQLGTIKNPLLTEISGLQRGLLFSDMIWAHNDSGDQPRLYGINTAGQLQAIYELSTSNRDWEDMAAFRFEGERFLVLGEIGDNRAQYKTLRLDIIPEPDFEPKPLGTSAQPVQAIKPQKIIPRMSIHFRYEDGRRDAESLAVDMAHRRILILSKRERIPRLYSLPFGEKEWATLLHRAPTESPKPIELGSRKKPLVAKKIASLHLQEDLNLRYREPLDWAFASSPTAMSLSEDGLRLVILSYICVYVYDRSPGETWDEAFKRDPWVYRYPKMKQAEAISMDGRDAVLICSEGDTTPLYRIVIQGNQ